MKNNSSTMLATILAMVIAVLSAIAYMRQHMLWQLIVAFVCLVIAVIMFMRYRRLKGTGTSTPSA